MVYASLIDHGEQVSRKPGGKLLLAQVIEEEHRGFDDCVQQFGVLALVMRLLQFILKPTHGVDRDIRPAVGNPPSFKNLPSGPCLAKAGRAVEQKALGVYKVIPVHTVL